MIALFTFCERTQSAGCLGYNQFYKNLAPKSLILQTQNDVWQNEHSKAQWNIEDDALLFRWVFFLCQQILKENIMKEKLTREITNHFDRSIHSLCENYSAEMIDWFVDTLGLQIAMIRDLEKECSIEKLSHAQAEQLCERELALLEQVLEIYAKLEFIDEVISEMKTQIDSYPHLQIAYEFYLTLRARLVLAVSQYESLFAKIFKRDSNRFDWCSLFRFQRQESFSFTQSVSNAFKTGLKTLSNPFAKQSLFADFGFT